MATLADSSTMDVTSAATWTSGSPSVASITSTGLATVLASSTTAVPITATFEGISNAASPAWLSALTVLPPSCPTPHPRPQSVGREQRKDRSRVPAIKQILNYVGTPYTVFDMADPANSGGITAAFLTDPSNSCHGFYNGVILANGGYIYTLPAPSMSNLTTYEQTFGVRQVNWYTFPGPDFGFTGTPGSNGNTGYTGDLQPGS